MKMPRRQKGQLYLSPTGAIRMKYWTTAVVDGEEVRKRKDVFICQSDGDRHTAEKNGDGWVFSQHVHAIKDRLLLEINDRQLAFHQPSVKTNTKTILGFWDRVYIPWAIKELRSSTVKTYVQIWRTHLKNHFGQMTFLDYTTVHASKYLTALAERGLSATTISHIRAVASGVFAHALAHHGLIPTNPWDGAKSSRKYRQAPATEFYTVEEAVALIAAMHDHPDWAALMGLCFYAGLRPSEAIALRWEDFKQREVGGRWFINISRGCVEGHVADTKTADSKAAVPVAKQLYDLLKVWHEKSKAGKEGWIFPGRITGKVLAGIAPTKPVDLRLLCQRQIKPAVIAAGFEWRGLYALRRGLATHLKDLDIMSAQAMLRHANPDTTQDYYAKLTDADKLRAIKFLEAGTPQEIT